MKYDPHYWFRKGLLELTDDEKRNYRIQKLNLVKKEKELKSQLRQIEMLRSELVEESLEFLNPIIEHAKPIIDNIVVPVADKVAKKTLECFISFESKIKAYNFNKFTNNFTYLNRYLKSNFSKLITNESDVTRQEVQSVLDFICYRIEFLDEHKDQLPVVKLLLDELCDQVEVKDILDEIIENISEFEDNNNLMVNDENLFDNAWEALQSLEVIIDRPDEEVEEYEQLPENIDNEVASNKTNSFKQIEENRFDTLNEKQKEEEELELSSDLNEDPINPIESIESVVVDEDDENEEEEEEDQDEEEQEEEGDEEEEEEVVKEVVIENIDTAKVQELTEVNQQQPEEEDEEVEEEEEEEDDEEEVEEQDEEKVDSDEHAPDVINETKDTNSASDDDKPKGIELEKLLEESEQVIDNISSNMSILEAMTIEKMEQIDEIGADILNLTEADTNLQIRRLNLYPVELIELMDEMILSIEFADENMKSEIAEIIEVPYEKPIHLFGCEVFITLYISDAERQLHNGLENLQSEDIAVMLQQQLNDLNSPLFESDLLKNLLDIQFKPMFKKRIFEKWEDFWIHVIHPTYFGYSAVHHKKNHSTDRKKNNITESGISFLNPTDNFNQRNKETFIALRQDTIDPSVREKVRKGKEDHKTHSVENHDGSTLNLNINEYVDLMDGKKLKLYRPNMEDVTLKDIGRLTRQHKAFEEKYEEEMRRGLIDGKRLRPEQYSALKDRDSAFRILRSAKQRYHRKHKHEGELILPPLLCTKVEPEVFQGWIDDLRLEDAVRLKESRLFAQKRKEILKEEAELRRVFNQRRHWVINSFISFCGKDSVIVGKQLQDKLIELENTDDVLNEDHSVALKKLIISEEKKSRRFFDSIIGKSNGRLPRIEEENPVVVESNSLLATDVMEEENEKNNDNNDNISTPYVLKDDLFHYIDKYVEAIKNEKYRIQLEQLRSEKSQKEESNKRRLDSLQRSQSKSKKKEFILLEESSDEDNDEIHELARKVAYTSVDISDVTSSELDLPKSIKWFEAISNFPQFYQCIHQFPTNLEGKFAKNELSQVKEDLYLYFTFFYIISIF